MRLITTRHFAERYFVEGSRPSRSTLRRWIEMGQLPGKRVGDVYYVDEDAWLADGDPLVEKVLNESATA